MIGNEENSDQLSICAVHYSTKVVIAIDRDYTDDRENRKEKENYGPPFLRDFRNIINVGAGLSAPENSIISPGFALAMRVKPPQPFDTASPRYGKYPGSESRYSAYKLTSAVTYMGEQHYSPRKSQILWQILAKIRSLKRRVPLVDRFVR
uniref:Uncharacterized protein n=1 Tax=Vespula pensylvanica TaxID=30213 RepID=A0A834PCJ9_VESPE|nr:hypothetical protein H0235_003787 [Vespula pensylvanica]